MSRTNQDRSPSGGYSDEFKVAAVRLVTEEGYSMAAAAKAVGVSQPSLKAWVAKCGPPRESPAALPLLRNSGRRTSGSSSCSSGLRWSEKS